MIASASVGSVSRTGTSGSSEPSTSMSAKRRARSDFSPTTIREGCRLSWSAFPSRRNSGEKITWSVPSRLRTSSTKPTGTVDFTTMVAVGLTAATARITASTEVVSKESDSGS